MGDAVWFFHHSGTQHGPVRWSELQERASRGELDPDDLVWQPEMSDWQPARTLQDLLPKSTSAVAVDRKSAAVWKARSSPARRTVVMAHLKPAESLLHWIQDSVSGSSIDKVDRIAAVIGHFTYLGGAAIAAALLLVIGVKSHEVVPIVLAVATIPAAMLLGYSAARMIPTMRSRIDTAPTIVGEDGFLDAFASSMAGIGLLTACSGLVLTVGGFGASPLVSGFGISLVLFFLAVGALKPSSINVSAQAELTTGDQVVAVLAFLAKLVLLRLAPVLFMIAAVAVLVDVVTLLVVSLGDTSIPVWTATWVWGRVLSVALLPMAAWLVFSVVWTTLEVATSLIARDTENG